MKITRFLCKILGTLLALYSSLLYFINALGDIGSTPYNKVSSFDYLLFVTGFLILVELVNIWTNISTFNSINNVISPLIILLAVFIKLKLFPVGMDEITLSAIVLSILIWVLNFRLKSRKTFELLIYSALRQAST
ncbi:hypothetical protein FEM46_16245 (plasmid) [Lactiplantibacillus plantarum subsp. plantarum]|uniref:hypothetical protein n=1 Tax=Lactiplantibacillus plantarum TaxID=1590 RepID=UPI0010FC338D|nr:hypothetical protein [Lactiplantibacillus plantarum]QCS78827.1 hypothetical protein FEM46_16245 [Lactiplantibacillus plantarum subsp. plantarum]